MKLGWEALENPSCSPIVLNAANELAVDAFLKNKIKFIKDKIKIIDKAISGSTISGIIFMYGAVGLCLELRPLGVVRPSKYSTNYSSNLFYLIACQHFGVDLL